jgi:hypothetical protein
MNEESTAAAVAAPAVAWPARMPAQPRRDPAVQERQQRLMRLHGPGELKAALLAIVRTPGSRREFNAWRNEVADVTTADAIRHDLDMLDPAARMAWFELFCERLAEAPLVQRKQLAQSVRRVMRADGRVRPLDRLFWLAVRRQLGEARSNRTPAKGDNDLSELPPEQVAAIAKFSAFISRLIPQRETEIAPAERSVDDEAGTGQESEVEPAAHGSAEDTAVRQAEQIVHGGGDAAARDEREPATDDPVGPAPPGDNESAASGEPESAAHDEGEPAADDEREAPADGDAEPPGERWFRAVMSNWPAVTAAREPVDGDTLLRALRVIQSLPWMLRPVLVRTWFEAAAALTGGRPLPPDAADALRLTCLLLDSPMPEGLARQFIEPDDR